MLHATSAPYNPASITSVITICRHPRVCKMAEGLIATGAFDENMPPLSGHHQAVRVYRSQFYVRSCALLAHINIQVFLVYVLCRLRAAVGAV